MVATAQTSRAREWSIGRFEIPIRALTFTLGVVVLAAIFVNKLVANGAVIDFEVYRSAALGLNDPGHLYDRAIAWRDAQWAVNQPGSPPTDGSPYVYPPAMALAFVPIATLPFQVGSMLWLLISFGSLVVTGWVLTGLLFRARPRDRIIAAVAIGALIALFGPMRAVMFFGQVDGVLLMLLCLSLAAFVRRLDARAGVFLALAVAVKPTLAVLVLFFLWKRAYRATIVFGVLSAAIVGASFAVVGLAVLPKYLAASTYWAGPVFGAAVFNQSPYGLLLRMFTSTPFSVPIIEAPQLVSVLRYALPILVAVPLIRSVSRDRDLPPAHLTLEYGLLLIAMLVAGPLSEVIHYVQLVIPLIAAAALLIGAKLESRVAWGASWIALVLIYVSVSPPKTPINAPIPAVGWQVLGTGIYTYALLACGALMLLLARWSARQPRVLSGPDVPQPLQDGSIEARADSREIGFDHAQAARPARAQ